MSIPLALKGAKIVEKLPQVLHGDRSNYVLLEENAQREIGML